jgi:class 3 adenylate cyclase
MNRKEYNRRAVKEYKSQSSTILQNYLIQRRYAPALLIRYDRFSSDTGEDTKLPFCETVFAAVMLADISGFTKLASQLNVEELKRHIKYVPLLCACLLFASNFFTLLLGSIIRRNKGDVIKFCGDAVLIMWSCPMTASAQIKRSCAIQATKCGLELLQNYGNYDSGGSGPNDKVVSLRLHCGMSVGPLHCMSLGTPQRMEFLISGRILHEMGVAENHSQLGEICLSQSAYELVENDFDGQHVTPETVKILGPKLTHRSMRQSNLKGNPLKSSVISVSKLLPRHQKKRHRVYVDTVYDDEGDEPLDLPHQISKGVGSLLQGQIENKDFKVALIRYVHESARKFILDSSDFIAEIRLVCTLFIQILNLDDDFNEGRPQRPQQVLLEILDILKRLGGALRQYVVDDKGCVVICNFGVSGFCSTNDPLRAVSAAMSIKDHLKECDVSCRIGVTQGMAYCGYVGSKDRKEFTVMGSCVNLAARLMGKASESQILVDTKIFLHTETDFEYDQTLPKIEAKGYSTPVQVYSPLSYHDDNNNTNRHFSMEEIVSQSHKTRLVPLVGRSYELSLLSHAISKILGQCSPHGHSAGAPPSSSMLTNPTSLKHKQMSLRATLSQIIEESSTKTAGNDIAISSSQSFNFDEKFFSPRLSLVSPVAHGPSHATAHLSSHSSSQDDNIYVIVGGPGYGKTTLINEVIARNASLMSPTIRISCHVSCMYEPYEVIGSLLEELMSHASLPPMATSTANKVRRNSSPRRRRRSSQDIFNSISEDEESFAGLGAGSQLDSPSNSHRSASITSIPFLPHEDPEYLRKQTKENLFESLCSWIEYNMPDTLFEYISSENIWKGSMSNSRSTIKIDSKEEEGNSNGGGGGLLAPHLLPERMASCLKSRSSRRFSVTSSVGGGIGGITISNKTKIFTAVELVPLLRICLNTEELPSSQLLAEFTSNGLEDMIASLVSEVLTQLLSSTRSKCMVIEDLHWCDKRSFEALMLTLSILEPDSFFLGSMRSMESSRSSRKSYAQILSSEGSVAINSLDDLHIDCQILELHPFTKSDVKHFIENTLGTSLLKESPNVLSDENVSRILGRSNSVPGEVAEQVKELEMQITRAKYGILDRMGGGGAGGGGRGYGSHQEENLLLYDELSKESQMIVKIAAVCGMTFPLGLLLHTLTEMGYKALLSNVERSLNQLEDKAIFKRVAYAPESIKRNESQSHLISVKSRYFRADTNSLSLRQTVAGGAGGRQQSQQQSTPGGGSADPMKRFYTFLNKSFRELIYSLMLTTQRTTAHALIGDFLANEYQEMQGPHDCQEAEALAYHYSKANDQLKEVYYTVEAAKLFQNQFKILTAFQHFHQLVVLSTRYDSIEEILQHCCARAVRASYHDIFVRTLFKQINFGPHFISTRYLEREEFVQPIHSVCSFIPSTHLSNFIAEMSILKFK